MKFYCSRNSNYFFAKGIIYRIKNYKKAGVFNPPLSYNTTEDVKKLAQE